MSRSTGKGARKLNELDSILNGGIGAKPEPRVEPKPELKAEAAHTAAVAQVAKAMDAEGADEGSYDDSDSGSEAEQSTQANGAAAVRVVRDASDAPKKDLKKRHREPKDKDAADGENGEKERKSKKNRPGAHVYNKEVRALAKQVASLDGEVKKSSHGSSVYAYTKMRDSLAAFAAGFVEEFKIIDSTV